MSSPFDEDCAAHEVAQSLGDFEVTRQTSRVEVDVKVLNETWFHRTPDYVKIRDMIEHGHTIPGARLVQNTEYILRKRSERKAD